MKPRCKVVCLIQDNGRTLLLQTEDHANGNKFLIPPGGGLEFGERIEAGLRREIREEVGIEVDDLVQVEVMESFFEFNGRDRHEIVFVFRGRSADPSLGAKVAVPIAEDDGRAYDAHWYTRAEAEQAGFPVLPPALVNWMS